MCKVAYFTTARTATKVHLIYLTSFPERQSHALHGHQQVYNDIFQTENMLANTNKEASVMFFFLFIYFELR